MLEGHEHVDAAYLGELPWAAATEREADTWREVSTRSTQPTSIKIYPAWVEYLWESSVLDCSINDAVQAYFPAPILFKEGKLIWVPGSREWRTPNGVSVAQYFEEGGHVALLVREDWLKQILRRAGQAVVFGWLGEKQLLKAGLRAGLLGDWIEIDAVASFMEGRWTFGQRRLKRRSLPK